MQRHAKYLDYKQQSRVDLDFDESQLLGKKFKNDLLKAKYLVQKTVHIGKKNWASNKFLAQSKPDSEAFKQVAKRTGFDTSRESSKMEVKRIPLLNGTRGNESFVSVTKQRAGVAASQIYGGSKELTKLKDQAANFGDTNQKLVSKLADRL